MKTVILAPTAFHWVTKRPRRGGTLPVRFVFTKLPGIWCTELYSGDELLSGMCVRRNVETFERSCANFIRRAQDLSVLEASLNGLVFAPENYAKEFLTPKHFLRMADALRRPRKSPPLDMVKLYMRDRWEKDGLNRMSREERVAHLNNLWGTDLTLASVAKLYEREPGLISVRPNGPKPRATS